MNARAMVNEFAKMRHLGVGLVALVMVLAVLGLSLFTLISSPSLDPDSEEAWNALLAGMSLAIPMVSPLLIAVLASRQTDIEHQGNGWLMQAASGLTPGAVCRAKAVALGVVVTVTTVGVSLLALLVGRLLAGITAPVPLGHWAGFTACMLVVNLVLLAVHILISAKLENQLVALGIGVIGTLIAVFAKGLPEVFAHITPWGYYSFAEAADYAGDEIVALPLSYPSIAALALFGAALFLGITARFDRQEA